ncbi:hypothetical protein, partial [Streptomyces sp. MRC013]|uniref:hypothetical protein n=1 Tax=Streptomyces sp. MRC013 TaxID=2898276 RepID=UPI0020270C9B
MHPIASSPTEWTPEKDIGINVTALNEKGVSYFVITPARSCTATGVAIRRIHRHHRRKRRLDPADCHRHRSTRPQPTKSPGDLSHHPWRRRPTPRHEGMYLTDNSEEKHR